MPETAQCVNGKATNHQHKWQSHLDRPREKLMEDVSPLLHQSDIARHGVLTLPVLDGVREAVGELPQVPQKVGLHKVHHCVVWREDGTHCYTHNYISRDNNRRVLCNLH